MSFLFFYSRRRTFPQSSKQRGKWRRPEAQMTSLLPSSPGGRIMAPHKTITWLMRHNLRRARKLFWCLLRTINTRSLASIFFCKCSLQGSCPFGKIVRSQATAAHERRRVYEPLARKFSRGPLGIRHDWRACWQASVNVIFTFVIIHVVSSLWPLLIESGSVWRELTVFLWDGCSVVYVYEFTFEIFFSVEKP